MAHMNSSNNLVNKTISNLNQITKGNNQRESRNERMSRLNPASNNNDKFFTAQNNVGASIK